MNTDNMAESMSHWVNAWGQAHTVIEDLSSFYRDRTVLVTVRSNLSGEKIRLRVSNREGKKPMRLTGGSVSTPVGETMRVLFAGQEALNLDPCAEVYSDAVTLPVRSGDHICVRLAFTGPVISGNSIETNVLYSKKGDFTAGGPFDTELPSQSVGFCGLDQAVPALSAIEVLTPDDAGAIICFGDSITQMGLWTTPLAEELLRGKPGSFSVINKGIGGNRLLHKPASVTYGRAGVERFERDVLEEAGAAAVILGSAEKVKFDEYTMNICRNLTCLSQISCINAEKICIRRTFLARRFLVNSLEPSCQCPKAPPNLGIFDHTPALWGLFDF